jgi:hypothetical protein
LSSLQPVMAKLGVFVALLLVGGLIATVAWGDDNPPVTTDSTTSTEVTTTVPTAPPVDMAKVRALRKAVVFHRTSAWRWETTSFVPLAKTHYAERRTTDITRLTRLWKWWSFVDQRAKNYAQHPPHLLDWMCIHSAIKGGRYTRSLQYLGGGYHVSGNGEASWSGIGYVHGIATYFGGLQADYGFMRSYGARFLSKKGTADHWTPLEQMWAAEQALKAGRGFYPWPTTARACGLI